MFVFLIRMHVHECGWGTVHTGSYGKSPPPPPPPVILCLRMRALDVNVKSYGRRRPVTVIASTVNLTHYTLFFVSVYNTM